MLSLAGLLAAGAARLVAPGAPPLYDGIVPVPPYVWLQPPPGQSGGAQGATAIIPVTGGSSPLIAVATPELVPQAQVFAVPDSFELPPGARSIEVAIEPIPTEGAPVDAHIDGNVYRITVTDQSGTALSAPSSARVSVVMRAADPTLGEADIARYAGGAWRPLTTSPSGQAGFIPVVTDFGDFAVLAPGAAPGGSAEATGPPAPSASTARSATATASEMAGSGGSAVQSAGPIAPEPGPGTASSPPWLSIGVGALFLAVLLVLVARTRARRRPYRGAHRARRR